MTEYKFGHPRFYELMREYMDLHDRKNHDYAGGGEPLGNFERVAAFFAMYPGLRLSNPVVYMMSLMMKQVDAVLWGLSAGLKHKVEGLSPRLADVTVYSVLARIKSEEAEAKAAKEQARLDNESRGATSCVFLPESLKTMQMIDWKATARRELRRLSKSKKRRIVKVRRNARRRKGHK